MIVKKNISRDDIAESINSEFGFSKKECLEMVNEIIEIIINGLQGSGLVKIHNFGTFTLKKKRSRIGRNPRTKQEVMIGDRNVITFKASKKLIKTMNNLNIDEKIS
tara:strand:- start:114 stop:431 length:318 start_codon:yes stop_codon:yes gene_type:complete